jgi:hypothetical protein
MERIAGILAGLFSSAFGIVFTILMFLSLPFNVIVWMRWMGWEWWSALLATIFSLIIPLVGQIVYLVFTFVGAYYFIDSGWNWRNAANPLPKTFSMSSLSPAEFESLKVKTILPELTRQCMNEAKARVGHDGKISVAAARFCECFAQAAVDTTTQDDLAYQEVHKKPAPSHDERLKAAVRNRCAS